MNRFSRLGTVVSSLFIVASCGQLIGLSDYEKVPALTGEGGEDATGGTRTGGKGGSTGGKGGSSGSTTGGKGGQGGSTGGKGGTGGGSSGDAGEAGSGADGGTGGKGGNGGNGGNNGGNGGDTGGSSGAGGSNGGTAGSGGTSNCIEITPLVPIGLSVDPPDPGFRSVVYDITVDPQLGSSLEDVVGIQLYSGTGFDGQLTGTFELGEGIDDNYSSCARCILIERDVTTVGNVGDTRFFGTSGTVTLDAASEHMDGRPIMTLEDVTLVEVTIDSTTYVSTPVPDGDCYHIESYSFSLPPEDYACAESTWGDGLCTCGCGTMDLECVSAYASACDDCGAQGSCATTCNDLTLDNNAECGGTAGWTCDAAAYGDGACSCGCGIPDPDCATEYVGACIYCDEGCGLADCTNIMLDDNTQCGSTAYTCEPTYYGDGLCDCGCGVEEPAFDCGNNPTVALCWDYPDCNQTGSCATSCADIDPANLGVCL